MRLDSAKVTVKCPKCNAPKKLILKQFLNQETVQCEDCGLKFQLKDKEGIAKRKVKATQQEIDEIERTLTKMGIEFYWTTEKK